MMCVISAKWKLHNVSALMQLKTEEGLDSNWAQTLRNTLGRWFLPRVPHSLHVDTIDTGGSFIMEEHDCNKGK